MGERMTAAEKVRAMVLEPKRGRCLCAGEGPEPGPCAYHSALAVAFDAVLAAEREAGQREGLEQAEAVIAVHRPPCFERTDHFGLLCRACSHVQSIRALAEKDGES